MKVLIPWLPSGYNQTYGQKRLKQAAKVYAGADYVLSKQFAAKQQVAGYCVVESRAKVELA